MSEDVERPKILDIHFIVPSKQAYKLFKWIGWPAAVLTPVLGYGRFGTVTVDRTAIWSTSLIVGLIFMFYVRNLGLAVHYARKLEDDLDE